MLALRVAAVVAVDAGLAGLALNQRGLVGGVAASGGGKFGEQGVDLGAQGGGGPQPALAHAVGLLGSPGKSAARRAVGIAEHPVGVEDQRQPFGHFYQLIGPHQAGLLGEQRFGIAAVSRADRQGQFVEEAGDHPDMLDVEVPGPPGRGGRRVAGWQRFSQQ